MDEKWVYGEIHNYSLPQWPYELFVSQKVIRNLGQPQGPVVQLSLIIIIINFS